MYLGSSHVGRNVNVADEIIAMRKHLIEMMLLAGMKLSKTHPDNLQEMRNLLNEKSPDQEIEMSQSVKFDVHYGTPTDVEEGNGSRCSFCCDETVAYFTEYFYVSTTDPYLAHAMCRDYNMCWLRRILLWDYHVLPLACQVRIKIRKCIGARKMAVKVGMLDIPVPLKKFIMLEDKCV